MSSAQFTDAMGLIRKNILPIIRHEVMPLQQLEGRIPSEDIVVDRNVIYKAGWKIGRADIDFLGKLGLEKAIVFSEPKVAVLRPCDRSPTLGCDISPDIRVPLSSEIVRERGAVPLMEESPIDKLPGLIRENVGADLVLVMTSSQKERKVANDFLSSLGEARYEGIEEPWMEVSFYMIGPTPFILMPCDMGESLWACLGPVHVACGILSRHSDAVNDGTMLPFVAARSAKGHIIPVMLKEGKAIQLEREDFVGVMDEMKGFFITGTDVNDNGLVRVHLLGR